MIFLGDFSFVRIFLQDVSHGRPILDSHLGVLRVVSLILLVPVLSLQQQAAEGAMTGSGMLTSDW